MDTNKISPRPAIISLLQRPMGCMIQLNLVKIITVGMFLFQNMIQTVQLLEMEKTMQMSSLY